MVGLTGYPNVGKSSTINALFGSKKTTVSSTPGKTKHFQTLNITARLTLVDCPGLVLPRYAASKAEMVAAGIHLHCRPSLPTLLSIEICDSNLTSLVSCLKSKDASPQSNLPAEASRGRRDPGAPSIVCNASPESLPAGVIPIDRLTDVRTPVAVVCGKVPRPQLEQVYGIDLPPPAAHESPDRPPTALEFLRALAIKRGWSSANGLPDETRAGRTILKDYTSGKLVSAEMPPGFHSKSGAAMIGGRFPSALPCSKIVKMPHTSIEGLLRMSQTNSSISHVVALGLP